MTYFNFLHLNRTNVLCVARLSHDSTVQPQRDVQFVFLSQFQQQKVQQLEKINLSVILPKSIIDHNQVSFVDLCLWLKMNDIHRFHKRIIQIFPRYNVLNPYFN